MLSFRPLPELERGADALPPVTRCTRRALDLANNQLEGFLISWSSFSASKSATTDARSSGSSSSIFSMQSLSSNTPGSSGISSPSDGVTLGPRFPMPAFRCCTNIVRALAKSHLDGLMMRSAELACMKSSMSLTRSSCSNSSIFCTAASSTPSMPYSSRSISTAPGSEKVALGYWTLLSTGFAANRGGLRLFALPPPATALSNACPDRSKACRTGTAPNSPRMKRPGDTAIRPDNKPRAMLTNSADTLRIGPSPERTTLSWNSS
mmetsp:Transcript_48303/g.151851  ORF Transcript_48303/g.151851 Transcript_48303/m.151851 type:complete len:264 (-) Transcript_48303:183-974(-)